MSHNRPMTVEIGRSLQGIVQNPDIYFDKGRLIVQYADNDYSSDAVQTNIKYMWFVSEDGGQSRTRSASATCGRRSPATAV